MKNSLFAQELAKNDILLYNQNRQQGVERDTNNKQKALMFFDDNNLKQLWDKIFTDE